MKTLSRRLRVVLAVVTLVTVLLAWLLSSAALAGAAAVTFLWVVCIIAGVTLLPGRERPTRST